MSNDKKANLSSLEALFGAVEDEADTELKNERAAAMPKGEQLLADVSRRMLRLERDMTMPGNASPAASRIERLSKFIEDENF